MTSRRGDTSGYATLAGHFPVAMACAPLHYPYIVGNRSGGSMANLGELERCVLMAIVHLRGHGYAVSINDEIKLRFGKSISLGAIYATVDRLEKKGFVDSRLGGPTAERGGRPKRFYNIRGAGERALIAAREADRRLWAGSPPLGAPA